MILKFRPGIRTEIVFTLTILMAGAIALIGILFLKVEEHNLLQQKIKGGQQVIASLEHFLKDIDPADLGQPGPSKINEQLQKISSLLGQSHLFSNFSIVDSHFRILADSNPEKNGKIIKDGEIEKAFKKGIVLTHTLEEEGSFSLVKKTPLYLSAPLILRKERWGAIRAEYALDDIREIYSRSQSMLFLYILFDAFILITVGTFLLSRIIIKPLKKLDQMTDKIAEGDLSLLSEERGGDEIGRLIFSFNRMASRLKEDRQKLQAYIQSLEKVNRELRQAQNELIRSEKLASIGRLAAGVAHEVGNPTSAILGYLDLLATGNLSPEEEKEVLQRAAKEAERIRRLIRELLDFSRPSPGVEEEVDINALILNTLSLLSHQKKLWDQVQVEKKLADDLPKWKGDPHQIQQVLINLLLNALDAFKSPDFIKTGREKKIRLATSILPPEEIATFISTIPRRRKEDPPHTDYSKLRLKGEFPRPAGEIVSIIQIEVEDNGPGIAAESINKIFDPFYTTKPPGEGTGLGLAICLRILESYGGRILVQSEEGKGANFIIQLPICAPIAAPSV
ncbi:MAG: ATP-binding protein [Thermodesulfobacteriota bacterium]